MKRFHSYGIELATKTLAYAITINSTVLIVSI